MLSFSTWYKQVLHIFIYLGENKGRLRINWKKKCSNIPNTDIVSIYRAQNSTATDHTGQSRLRLSAEQLTFYLGLDVEMDDGWHKVTFTKSVSECSSRENPFNRGVCATIPQVTTIQGKAHWYGIFVFVQIKEKNQNKTTPFGGKDEEQSVFPRISVTWLYRTVVEPFWRAETV